jgi:Zn-dependent protease
MISVPYRLDFSHLPIDDTISFCVAVLMAITINAEGQAFTATFLGDTRTDSKDRFHFNPLFHIDIFGLICFFVAGFGWSKNISVDKEKFSQPLLFTVLSRSGGVMANLLLASIAGSIVWVKRQLGWEDNVFPIVMAVNVAVVVYNILPIPPLAGAKPGFCFYTAFG